MLSSHSLLFSDFDTKWYKRWAKELKQTKGNLGDYQLRANKFWQNAVMVQALYERKLLEPDKLAIGFGVGQERLPALFAKYGVQVTATDQDFTTKKAKHWQKHELATSAQSLNKLGICDPRQFSKNVSYRSLDMNNVPKSLNGRYDFAWSNCALGHLGSIEAGLQFIIESAKCLKPGGYAVHTTEVNVLSNNDTVDNNPETVVFRLRDIHRLSIRLQKLGFQLMPLHFSLGDSRADQRINMSPEFGNDYSKLQVGGHILTQVVLIIRNTQNSSMIKFGADRARERTQYQRNVLQQKKFTKRHKFLAEIRAFEKETLDGNSIAPVKTTYSITLKDKPKELYLEYKNKSQHPIFGMHDRLVTTKPIALATTEPADRSSIFQAKDWFNDQGNRPSIRLCLKDVATKEWVKADYIRPGASFAYQLTLDPKRAKKGTYSEKFSMVQEGKTHIDGSEVEVKIKVN
jgi:SAM-dependent methyltransferase